MGTIVSVKNVSKTFPVGKTLLGRPDKFVHAVNNVSFDTYTSKKYYYKSYYNAHYESDYYQRSAPKSGAKSANRAGSASKRPR